MIVSVTRLRVRSVFYLPAFLWTTVHSQRQAVQTPGFLGGRLLADVKRTYWTLTGWEDERAMKSFRGSGAHSKVMPRLAEWCDEAAYTHWDAPNGPIPDWPEAYERLVKEGRLSRVAHPSADHETRRFPSPRLSPLIGQNLKPKVRADA
jgi:hypothetical protein